MERAIERDEKYRPILKIVQIIYLLTGLGLTAWGCIRRDSYVIFVSAGTLALGPGLVLLRRLLHLRGGWQLETAIYLFSYLGWTLGGAAGVYGLLPGFDKAVHCLSGVFVSMLALAAYRLMAGRREKDTALSCSFVFSASMAVAGLFELCEFTLAPIMQRDLQHVLDTGVMDTMMDMLVCLIGTAVFVLLMIRSSRGKHDFLTDGPEAFAALNRRTEKDDRKDLKK